MLHAEVEGAGPRLVLVHGFTQTGRCWGPVGDDLASDHEVVRVDAPGHGRSPVRDLDLWAGAGAIAAAGGRGTYVGYSMGGRYLLHLALAVPDLVGGLVVIGATGGIAHPRQRGIRRRSDEAVAAALERDGVAAFLDRWLAQPLFAGLDESVQHRAERATNTAAGLAASLRRAGTGTQEPLWDRLGELAMPVLVLAGERDAKFRSEGERLGTAIGANATVAVVPGAGHTAHLEAPAAFLAILRPWLRTHGL